MPKETIDVHVLINTIQAQRYQVLVALKPDSKARTTWNRLLQAIVDSYRHSPDYNETTENHIKSYFLEVTL